MKYVKKQGNKWVFYTENSIHLQILHHSCNCIWPTSDHIWNTLYLYGTPINGDLSAPWRECRSLHLRCALKAGVLDMSLCFSHATCLATLACRRRYLKLCLLYKVVNGQLTFPVVPIVPRSQARLLRNSSTLALERPVTRSNAYQSSFFPDTIALWNSLPSSVQNCQSLDSFKQTVLCHTLNTSIIPIT